MSDDPELNPWLPVEREAIVRGVDQYGESRIEILRWCDLPDYYFWLGADAYAEWPVVMTITVDK